jgi:hypothetical protein
MSHPTHDNCAHADACYEWGCGAGWRDAVNALADPEQTERLLEIGRARDAATCVTPPEGSDA